MSINIDIPRQFQAELLGRKVKVKWKESLGILTLKNLLVKGPKTHNEAMELPSSQYNTDITSLGVT